MSVIKEVTRECNGGFKVTAQALSDGSFRLKFSDSISALTTDNLSGWHSLAKMVMSVAPDPLPQTMATGELIGYRIWKVNRNNLQSLFRNYIWDSEQPTEAFVSDDVSGVYAFKARGEALSEFYLSKTKGCYLVFGSVYLWGEVVEHQLGYRAQFAEIRSLEKIRWTGTSLKQWTRQPIRCLKFWFNPAHDKYLQALRIKYKIIDKGEHHEDVSTG